jgi:hypothetical protein
MITHMSSESPNRTAPSGSERRQNERYAFIGIAELTDPDDAKLVSGRVSQISRGGCYVDTPMTFPVGTSLKAIVSCDERTFVAKARVIHVQEQIGMGLAFLDAPQDQLRILDSWIAQAPGTSGASNIRQGGSR